MVSLCDKDQDKKYRIHTYWELEIQWKIKIRKSKKPDNKENLLIIKKYNNDAWILIEQGQLLKAADAFWDGFGKGELRGDRETVMSIYDFLEEMNIRPGSCQEFYNTEKMLSRELLEERTGMGIQIVGT